MALQLSSLADLARLDFSDIIDVRSPSEFAEDHIPGAINLPVLNDEERAVIGTMYVQDDSFKAKRLGAALVARNSADHIEKRLSDRDGAWRPLVYCWRGGQRSGSFASILSQIGWRTELLQGGYKSYRKLVVEALYQKPVHQRVILIDGNTGTAKTEILLALKDAGGQVVDLEGLAAHRGSLLGAVKGGQPSQKAFESALAMELTTLDPSKPLFLEAESNKIGDILIPPMLWKAMMAAPRITISASLESRADFLMRSYSDLLEDIEALKGRIEKLGPYQPKELVEHWLALASNEEFHQLALELMETHYDPRYAKTYARTEREEIGTVILEDLKEETLLGQAVGRILDLSKALTGR